MNDDDLFVSARELRSCQECGATEGHYVHCPVLAEKHGICPVCWLARPCDCEPGR